MKGKEEGREYSLLNFRYILVMKVLIIAGVLLLGFLSGCGNKKPAGGEEETETEQTSQGEDESSDSSPDGADDDGKIDSESRASFADDENIYKLEKVLADGMSYCEVAYNDDCFVVGLTKYDPDYVLANDAAYPDGMTLLSVGFYDYDGREIGGFTQHNDSDDNYYNFNMDSKGNAYFIHSISNYDESRGYFTAYELVAYDKRGELVDSAIFEDEDDDFYVKDIMIDDKDRLIALTNKGIMTFKDRDIADRINYDDAEDFSSCYPMQNGDIAITTYGAEDMGITEVNLDSRMRKDPADPPFSLSGLFAVNVGTDSDLVLTGDSGIYKYNVGEKDCEKVMAFPVKNKLINYLNNVKVLDNGNVIGSYYDYEDEDYKVALFTPDDAASDTREKITLGCVGAGDDHLKQVNAFNESDTEHRIVVHDYAKLGILSDYEAGNKALMEDMKSGNGPDIVILNSGQPYEAYMTMGLLADQKPFIENDPQIDIDNYSPNVIEAMSRDDKLLMFSPDFTLNTVFAKSAYMGDGMGNKLTDYLYASDWTNTSVFGSETKGTIFYNIMRSNGNDFIDWKNLTCSFDTTQFQKILSFANTYPMDYDYNSYDDSHEGPYSDYALPFRNGETLCEMRTLYDINGYIEASQGVFGDEVTMVGYPTSGDVGSSISFYNALAITENCSDKEGAWAFVRRFYDVNIGDDIYLSIPASVKGLEKAVKDAGGKYKNYTDESNYTWEDPTFLVGSEYVPLKPLSKKESDGLIGDIYKVNRLSMDDSEITNILSEESEGYFMGAYDAATASKAIQERVTEYLDGFK